jgi:hypothetical protein
MLKRGYQRISEIQPDQPIEADMATDDGSDTWTGTLDPVHLSEHRAFWWRPSRGKDDLWMEVMALRNAQGAKIT